MPTEIYFLRHAQGLHNAWPTGYVGDARSDPLFRDAPLTTIGALQTVAAQPAFAGINFDAIYCSPMRRCRQTLLGIYPESASMQVVVDDRLIEQPSGGNICDHRLEHDWIVGNCPDKWDLSGVQVVNPFLNGSAEGDAQKIRNITQHILRSHPGGRVLVVGHGRWIKNWFDMYKGAGSGYYLANCAFIVTTVG